MEFKSVLAARYLRVIAIVALLLGLADAAMLLGVSGGAQSPIAQLGVVGFTVLAVFCIARLFSAVGLWIHASWGAVLLFIATLLELVLYAAGLGDIRIGPVGFAVRLLLLGSVGVLFFLSFRMRRAHD